MAQPHMRLRQALRCSRWPSHAENSLGLPASGQRSDASLISRSPGLSFLGQRESWLGWTWSRGCKGMKHGRVAPHQKGLRSVSPRASSQNQPQILRFKASSCLEPVETKLITHYRDRDRRWQRYVRQEGEGRSQNFGSTNGSTLTTEVDLAVVFMFSQRR